MALPLERFIPSTDSDEDVDQQQPAQLPTSPPAGNLRPLSFFSASAASSSLCFALAALSRLSPLLLEGCRIFLHCLPCCCNCRISFLCTRLALRLNAKNKAQCVTTHGGCWVLLPWSDIVLQCLVIGELGLAHAG